MTATVGDSLATEKMKQEYRKYVDDENDKVTQLYRINHIEQTYDLVQRMKQKYSKLDIDTCTVWEALEFMDKMTDESDPDTNLSQMQHAMQSAEAARQDGQPRWMQLVCLIHDLGKRLALPPLNEPQHLTVGDTFPVGCAFSPKIVHSKFFALNPDYNNPAYSTKFGVYAAGCGLHNIHMSWGHDEYLYYVVKDFLPPQASFVIRFHSFYSCHTENQYQYLMNEKDHEYMHYVREFNKFDLYPKHGCPIDVTDPSLLKYYKALVLEFFPERVRW